MVKPGDTLLGQEVRYDHEYDVGLLQPIPREEAQKGLGLPSNIHGEDVWTCYEFSCLLENGLPVVAIVSFSFPHTTKNIIESKSFKLYLNSYNYETFANLEDARLRLVSDLSKVAAGSVEVSMHPLAQEYEIVLPSDYSLLDQTLCSSDPFVYEPDGSLLKTSDDIAEESLYSDLLRSNCPVTAQPDWASIFIKYRGPAIEHESLLRYIVSFRNCQEFHEHCVEQIFCDLMQHCHCESLSVYARYTRRGGLDINPYRSTKDLSEKTILFRTPRQ